MARRRGPWTAWLGAVGEGARPKSTHRTKRACQRVVDQHIRAKKHNVGSCFRGDEWRAR